MLGIVMVCDDFNDHMDLGIELISLWYSSTWQCLAMFELLLGVSMIHVSFFELKFERKTQKIC